MTVAENIKRLRKEQGFTQKQLAEKCNMSESTLRQYEIGYRNPKIETLHKIAQALNKSIVLLVEGCEDKYPLGERDFKINSENSVTSDEKYRQQNIPQGYYLNEDARDMAQFLYDNPEYKVLFDATRKVKKEDILFVKEMIDRMNGKAPELPHTIAAHFEGDKLTDEELEEIKEFEKFVKDKKKPHDGETP